MKIYADDYFKKIEDIPLEYFDAHNVAGILLDVDNTIVTDGGTEILPSVLAWLKNITLPVCLLSNGKEERVKRLADSLGFAYVYRAKKPFRSGYAKAAKLLNADSFEELAVIGDQLLSDILGGTFVGCYTIKIEPIDKTSDPFPVKAKRWAERFF